MAGRAQPFRCDNLGGHAALCIAGASAEDEIAFLSAREKRRHAIDVRGKHDVRRINRCKNIEPVGIDGLLENIPPTITKLVGYPARDRRFATGGRIDVNQSPKQRHGIGYGKQATLAGLGCHGTMLTGRGSER
jgi:hypothetical protein